MDALSEPLLQKGFIGQDQKTPWAGFLWLLSFAVKGK